MFSYRTSKFAKRQQKAAKFKEKNEERYGFLVDIRDEEGRRPGEPNYDPRTLFIPDHMYAKFTKFEKQVHLTPVFLFYSALLWWLVNTHTHTERERERMNL